MKNSIRFATLSFSFVSLLMNQGCSSNSTNPVAPSAPASSILDESKLKVTGSAVTWSDVIEPAGDGEELEKVLEFVSSDDLVLPERSWTMPTVAYSDTESSKAKVNAQSSAASPTIKLPTYRPYGGDVLADHAGGFTVYVASGPAHECRDLNTLQSKWSYSKKIRPWSLKLNRLSPDGKRFASMIGVEGTRRAKLQVWKPDPDAENPVAEIDVPRFIHYWSFLDSKRLVAVTGNEFPRVDVWDVDTGKRVNQWTVAEDQRGPQLEYKARMVPRNGMEAYPDDIPNWSASHAESFCDRSPGVYHAGTDELFFVWETHVGRVRLSESTAGKPGAIEWFMLEMPRKCRHTNGHWSIGFDPAKREVLVGARGAAVFLIQDIDNKAIVRAKRAAYGLDYHDYVGQLTKLDIGQFWLLRPQRYAGKYPDVIVDASTGVNIGYVPAIMHLTADGKILVNGRVASSDGRYQPYFTCGSESATHLIQDGLEKMYREITDRGLMPDDTAPPTAKENISNDTASMFHLTFGSRERMFSPVVGSNVQSRVAEIDSSSANKNSRGTNRSIKPDPGVCKVSADLSVPVTHHRVRFMPTSERSRHRSTYGGRNNDQYLPNLRGSTVLTRIVPQAASRFASQTIIENVFCDRHVMLFGYSYPELESVAAINNRDNLLAVSDPNSKHSKTLLCRLDKLDKPQGDIDTRDLFPRDWPGHGGRVDWLGWHRDHLLMVTGGRMLSWQVKKHPLKQEVAKRWKADLIGDYTGIVAWGPDRSWLVAESHGQLDLIDARSVECVARLGFPASLQLDDPAVNDLEVSPTGKYVAALVVSRDSKPIERFRGRIHQSGTAPRLVIWELDASPPSTPEAESSAVSPASTDSAKLHPPLHVKGAWLSRADWIENTEDVQQPPYQQFNNGVVSHIVSPEVLEPPAIPTRVSWINTDRLLLMGPKIKCVTVSDSRDLVDFQPLSSVYDTFASKHKSQRAYERSRFRREMNGVLWDRNRPLSWAPSDNSVLGAIAGGSQVATIQEVPVQVKADIISSEASKKRVSQITKSLIDSGYRIGPGGIELVVTGKLEHSSAYIELQTGPKLFGSRLPGGKTEQVEVKELDIAWEVRCGNQVPWKAETKIQWSPTSSRFKKQDSNELLFPENDAEKIRLAIKRELIEDVGNMVLPKPLPTRWIKVKNSWQPLTEIRYE